MTGTQVAGWRRRFLSRLRHSAGRRTRSSIESDCPESSASSRRAVNAGAVPTLLVTSPESALPAHQMQRIP